MSLTVSFQGEHGAYSHLAITELYPDANVLPCPTFEEAIASVQEKKADYAMLPIENSQWGRVADIHHLLPESDLFIIAEHFHRVHHNLLGLPEATLEDIRQAYSHPQALGQCRLALRNLNITAVPSEDTAGSALFVSRQNDKSKAAIASSLAADIYGLSILKSHIEDADHNTTRFLVMAREPFTAFDGTQKYMTSMIFRTKNLPASLYKALGGFATNGINITKLESYQLEGKFFATQFFIEIEGHPKEKSLQNALDELSFYTRHLKILGSYHASKYRSDISL